MRLQHLSTVAIALCCLVPSAAEAAIVLSVESPTIAGLGTQIQVQGLIPSARADISVQSPAGQEILIPVVADSKGSARGEVKNTEMQVAGAYSVQIEADGTVLAGPQAFQVLPDSVDVHTSKVEAGAASLTPDGQSSVSVTVTLRDRFGNALPGRPVTLLSSRTADDVSARSKQTDEQGKMLFLVTTTLPGTMTLRAIDLLSAAVLADAPLITVGTPATGGPTTAMPYAPFSTYVPSPAVTTYVPMVAPTALPQTFYPSAAGRQQMFYAQTAAFDVLDHFEIQAPTTLPAGEEAPQIVVRAVDRSGNTVEDYVGSIVFSSTDPSATLPNFGKYTFKDRDLGVKQFPLVLKFEQGGPQTLRVEDSNDPSIIGTTTIQVAGGHSAAATINVTSPKDGDAVNTTSITVTGVGPKFANLLVMGGVQDVTGATDKDGNFSVPINLDPKKHEFTIRVHDDAGRNDSGPINITLETEPPQIGAITFSPEHPNTGDKVLVVVQSKPQLKSVTMQLQPQPSTGDAVVNLIESVTGSGSGMYQGFFPAPDRGAYQALVTATDRAGNTADVRATFTVGTNLGAVQNLRGEVHGNAASLEWDAPLDTVDGERIYVGERPDNFLYTLDTGRATTKATVAGLVPGRSYYFAATALRGQEESAQKSNVLKLDVPGLVLTVTPGNGTLRLDWQPPKVSLRSYTLEYGVQQGTYTEKRIVTAKAGNDGTLQSYTLSDLLNGVTYYMRLTPVTVTGDALTDLAATGQGAPNGQGFTAGPSDPIPFNPGTVALEHAPKVTSVGLPAWIWGLIAAVILGGCALQWHRRSQQRQTAAFLAAIQRNYGNRG